MANISEHFSLWGWKGSSLRHFKAPESAAYKIYWVTFVLGLLLFANVLLGWPSQLYTEFAFAFFSWSVWVVIALWLITRLDVFDSVPTSVRFAILFWSAVMANGGASFLNSIDLGLGETSIYTVLRNVFTEEALKFSGLLIIYNISPAVFRRPAGAIVCGFIAGIGFAFNESFKLSFSIIETVVSDGDGISPLFDWIFRRGVLYSPWTHSAATGAAALCLWAFATRDNRTTARTVVLCSCFLAISFFIHFLVNYLTLGNATYWGVLFWMAPELISFVSFCCLILWALRTEQFWFCESTKRLSPYLETSEVPELLTRMCRAGKRAYVKSVYGRRRKKLLYNLQRMQIAYVNVLTDPKGKDTEQELAAIRKAIIMARTCGQASE